jgi:hypothetical protein
MLQIHFVPKEGQVGNSPSHVLKMWRRRKREMGSEKITLNITDSTFHFLSIYENSQL